MGTVIVVTSGKGGTGKTSLTAGVASCLAALGQPVLCVDMDIGLRNLDISLGMTDLALMDFTDVISGRCPLRRAAAAHPSIPGLFLLTAPLSLSLTDSAPGKNDMRSFLRAARLEYRFILLDSPAGLGTGFQLAACCADRAIVVSTTDSSALRDAQRTVSELGRTLPSIHLVMNRVQPKLMRRLHATIDDAMDTAGLPLLGVVPEDSRIMLAANSGQPLILTCHKGAAVAYLNIAKRLAGQKTPLMKIR